MDNSIIINKYLALKKIASRREAERLVRAGKVKINGRPAKLGEMVKEGDKVETDVSEKKSVYLAFHKPEGIITHSPQKGEKSIADILRFKEKVFPLGRLDKASRGLIILANDGRLTGPLLDPEFKHEKEYEVKISRALTDKFLKSLAAGVRLDDGYRTKKCRVRKISERIFSIILTEGKKHQIRRMCEALGEKVIDLKRVRIMNIRLGDLPAGRYRQLLGRELKDFLLLLGLPPAS